MEQYKVLLTLLLAFQAVAIISCSAVEKLKDSELDEYLLQQLEVASENLCGPPDLANTCVYSNTGTIADASQCTALCEARVGFLNFIYSVILWGPCRGRYRKFLGQCMPGSTLPPYGLFELSCVGVCMLENGDMTLGGLILTVLRIVLRIILPPWIPVPFSLEIDLDKQEVVTAQMLNVVNEFVERSSTEDFDYSRVLESSLCAGHFEKLEGKCHPIREESAFEAQQLVCTAICQVDNGEESLLDSMIRLFSAPSQRR